MSLLLFGVFTRAMLASAGISGRRVSVHPSVCLFVTSRCSSETAKRRITHQHHTMYSSYPLPKISAKLLTELSQTEALNAGGIG